MGGARSKEEPVGASGATPAVDASSVRPYFFLASCPDDSLQEATSLADKYGGFHCVGDGGDGFEAWKGRAAGQFLTLRRLSPAGRKVVGIAIAGFGRCNDEREFLRQLGSRPGHEQFEFKQCGDTRDMERWLQSEGYPPLPLSAGAGAGVAAAGPSPEESGRTQAAGAPAGLWASMTSLFGAEAATAAPGAWKERWLSDVQHALARAEAADEASAEALTEAAEALSSALRNARGAGVPDADIEAAARRLEDLRRLAREAERRRGFCPGWLCCAEVHGWSKAEDRQEAQLVLATGDTKLAEPTATGASTSTEALARGKGEMKTVLPFRGRGGPLPPGTKCRYKSPRNGWLAAAMEGFNPCDGTCNLDIKKHAKPETIFPAANVTEAQAWPVGTLVEYQSSSAGHWLEATVCAFNEGGGGTDCTYDLDLRERAAVDRIRLRIA